ATRPHAFLSDGSERGIAPAIFGPATTKRRGKAMAKYRHHLPQLNGNLFLTDAGIETTLIFHEGLDLPYFAAFHLLKDEEGRQALKKYFRRHAAIARENGTGFILESATWRASADWGDKLGYSAQELD